MAEKHPYISGTGALFQLIEHLRKSFPGSGVTADTLKKLGLASNNETYVINTLRFIGVIEEDGKKTEAAAKVFNHHNDDEFKSGFEGLVEKAYADLFALHGPAAWTLDQDALIQFFRSSDETSAVVGRRQATVFQALSAMSGHGESPVTKARAKRASANGGAAARAPAPKAKPPRSELHKQPEVKPPPPPPLTVPSRDVGLTVRVEINLPTDGDQETYDRIFRSIRENLLNGD